MYLTIKIKSAFERLSDFSHVFFILTNYTTLSVRAKGLLLPYLDLHAVFWRYINYSTLQHFSHSLISVLWYHTKSQWPRDLRPLACWDCGFESHRGHECLSVVSAVCCQVEVSATDWSLVQRSRTYCGASLCVIKKPRKRGGYFLCLPYFVVHNNLKCDVSYTCSTSTCLYAS